MNGKTKKRVIVSMVIAWLFLLLTISIVQASPITVPPGLNHGDQYRLAFVTSTERNALSDDIADYNAFVSGVANSVPALTALGVSWTAIGSTNSIDARDNTGTNPDVAQGVPIYNTSGTLVVHDNADLWDGDALSDSMGYFETGQPVPGPGFQAWTGTRADGVRAEGFGLGAATGSAVVGIADATFFWIDFDLDDTWIPQFLYGISSTLTVPIPVPTSIVLLVSGLISLAGLRIKGRKT